MRGRNGQRIPRTTGCGAQLNAARLSRIVPGNLILYEYIFASALATLTAAMAAAWLAGALTGNPRIAMRSVAFNYGPPFACAFYMVGVAYDGQISGLDLAAGLLFEFAVLFAFTKLLSHALMCAAWIDDHHSVERWLRWSLATQLLLAWPLLVSEGFGIFSDGSRIAYLDGSGAAKYLTYAGVLIAPVQAGLIAKRLSANHSPGPTSYAIFVATFVLSTLSGSKGGFFLWIVSVMALIDYRRLRIHWAKIFLGATVILIALVITANVVSETLGISTGDFAELAAARFLLSNDARALALDYGSAHGGLSELLASSFRSLSTLLGRASSDLPLGLVLYEQQFGFSTGNGANTSLLALISYYSMRGYTLLPVLVACIGLGVVYGIVVSFRRAVRGRMRKMAVSLIGLTLVQQMSQDFLAFQLLVPLACIAGLIFLLTDRKYAGARPQRPRPSPRIATHQHRHSGS